MSFERYFKTDRFLFIVRDVYGTADFIKQEILEMGILHYDIVVLDSETCGQAETVYLGLKEVQVSDEDLVIFNIDSRRYNYQKPIWLSEVDGYLEVFLGEGDHWSFAEPVSETSDIVKRTAEKTRISDFCSNGLYFFKDFNTFETTYIESKDSKNLQNGELYIAPLYNFLIQKGCVVRMDVLRITETDFCGTPEEYQNILSSLPTSLCSSGFLNTGEHK